MTATALLAALGAAALLPHRKLDALHFSHEKTPSKALTLVLDLDHTLICGFANETLPIGPKETGFYTQYEGEMFSPDKRNTVYLRPSVVSFLRWLNNSVPLHVVLWTNSPYSWSRPILDRLEEHCGGRVFKARYDHRTVDLTTTHSKDLANLFPDLRRVLLLDDKPSNGRCSPSNVLPIRPFLHRETDHELDEGSALRSTLIEVCQAASTGGDVRRLPAVRRWQAAHGYSPAHVQRPAECAHQGYPLVCLNRAL
ncbi:unnamed protein product [Vitrella brassicaformis CCMP3155]|uniref:Mitochondrial import inner membrane translocase subunit TIM50 n=1 Tax=Vitrella brassicaformis (strain CCMP3155) TaxID=1169540 RepID=A0A0G4FXI0_VITBC|nr:unnamed protein product [Vitrella brassicaformis CCMP3155]|eukprot:CEM20120.1 unnamed protein product [Vitrella brassicaformis CCMP3155]